MNGIEDITPPARPARGVARRGHRLLWSIPLGWQLSALYTLLLVATLALVGTLVYTQQESFLVQDTAGRLEQTAARIVARPVHVPNDGHGPQPGPPGGTQPLPSDSGRAISGDQGDRTGPPVAADSAGLLENLVRGLSGPGVSVAILNQQGTVITTTQGLAGDSPPVVDPVTPQQAATALASGRSLQWVAQRSDGSRYVVVLLPVVGRVPTLAPAGSGTTGTLLVEQSAALAAVDAALERLRTVLLLGVLASTLAGVVLVLLFTRAVLRPLDRVATTAEAIAGGDLERRLQLPAGRNEVARLGHTFDYMVGRLVATLAAQRRFVADASHELRTPLTSLKGLTEILMIGAHGDDSRVIEQSARAIHDELDRLSRLVNDLLTLSRLDSTSSDGGLPARRVRMDACATLNAAANQMSALAEARGVRLTQECAVPLWISGDPGQLKQVLLNLIDNALRYTPAGGAVQVRGTLAGATAEVAVQDTGVGIAAPDLPRIFERFYRGDTSRARTTGNSGLGLAIVRAIVEAHGGQITVQSTPGVGTCFTIRLPLAPAHPPVEEPVAAEAAH